MCRLQGQCNRNGEVELASVFLVNLGFENLSRLPTIKSGRDATLKVIDDIKKGIGKSDLLAEENISKYFKYYYKDNDEYLDIVLDESITMVDILGANKFYGNSYNKSNKNDILICKQPFKYAEEAFYVIKNSGRSVIVPYGGGEEIIAELISGQDIYQKKSILSKAQVFTINLFEHEWITLDKNDGVAKTDVDGVFVLKSRFYDKDYGLDIDGFARVDTDSYQFNY